MWKFIRTGAGSLCGKNLSPERWSTIGKQKQFNYALQDMSRNAFVKMLTAELRSVLSISRKTPRSTVVVPALLSEVRRCRLDRTPLRKDQGWRDRARHASCVAIRRGTPSRRSQHWTRRTIRELGATVIGLKRPL